MPGTETPSAQSALRACSLPEAWQGQPAWRVLDTSFGCGSAFFATWQVWADDPHRPHLLHYVAIAPEAPALHVVLQSLAAYPTLAGSATQLERQWFGFLPGFHRLALAQGRVLLTLCVGALQPMLREQQFTADSVFLQRAPHPADSVWDRWSIKALARLCRRGTAVANSLRQAPMDNELVQSGFALLDGGSGCWHYQPPWEPGHTRRGQGNEVACVSSCAVIGAGLAGATVAHALARRGWRVTVLDSAAQPAAGASGLPVGLLAPQVSRDDSARSRLVRAGLRQTLQLCHELLQYGQDWTQTGVLELRQDGHPALPDAWPAQGAAWSADRGTALWHAAGGWIKPARLVQRCLEGSHVEFVGNSAVSSIARHADQWVLRDDRGRLLAQASQVVIAAAGNSVQLLDKLAQSQPPSAPLALRLAPMGALAGQVTWALQEAGDEVLLAACRAHPYPVNGHGSFVSQVPMHGAQAWFAGATYEPEPATPADVAASHRDNLARLSHLLPQTANALAPRFASGQVQAWRGVRCTTLDRLPAVGPAQDSPLPSLWISAGLGSRGLTYAALCAELLAARLGAEPLPVEASLWKIIGATRRGLRRPTQ